MAWPAAASAVSPTALTLLVGAGQQHHRPGARQVPGWPGVLAAAGPLHKLRLWLLQLCSRGPCACTPAEPCQQPAQPRCPHASSQIACPCSGSLAAAQRHSNAVAGAAADLPAQHHCWRAPALCQGRRSTCEGSGSARVWPGGSAAYLLPAVVCCVLSWAGFCSQPVSMSIAVPAGASCNLPMVVHGQLLTDCTAAGSAQLCYPDAQTAQACSSTAAAPGTLFSLASAGQLSQGGLGQLCSLNEEPAGPALPCATGLTCVAAASGLLAGSLYGYCSRLQAVLGMQPWALLSSLAVTPRATVSGAACELPLGVGGALQTDCVNGTCWALGQQVTPLLQYGAALGPGETDPAGLWSAIIQQLQPRTAASISEAVTAESAKTEAARCLAGVLCPAECSSERIKPQRGGRHGGAGGCTCCRPIRCLCTLLTDGIAASGQLARAGRSALWSAADHCWCGCRLGCKATRAACVPAPRRPALAVAEA